MLLDVGLSERRPGVINLGVSVRDLGCLDTQLGVSLQSLPYTYRD